MDAIVTAGGIPQRDDPLYTYSHGDSKALIDVAGKPMVQPREPMREPPAFDP